MSVHEIQPGLLDRYRKAAIQASIIMRVNLWEDLLFDDMTPSVMATMKKASERIMGARSAFIEVLASDSEVTQAMVEAQTKASEAIIDNLYGRELSPRNGGGR